MDVRVVHQITTIARSGYSNLCEICRIDSILVLRNGMYSLSTNSPVLRGLNGLLGSLRAFDPDTSSLTTHI
jgi:hypothetical protein